jgi:hypothetical protein
VYQGTEAAPSFIFGLSTVPWSPSGTVIGTTTSLLPSSLTNTGLNVSIEFDDVNGGAYAGPLYGTQKDLLSSLCAPISWNRSDVINYPVNPLPHFDVYFPSSSPTLSPTPPPTTPPVTPLVLDPASLMRVKAFKQTSLYSIGAAKCRRMKETTVKYKRIFFTTGLVSSPPAPPEGAAFLTGRVNGVLSVEDPKPTGPEISNATVITFVLYDLNNKTSPMFKYMQKLVEDTANVQATNPIENHGGDFKFQFDLEKLVAMDGSMVRFPVGANVKIEIQLANKQTSPEDEKYVLDCVRLGILRY